VVRHMVATLLVATLAGCGGGDGGGASSPAPAGTAAADEAPAADSKQVVFFQRQGAAGATLDALTVRADGSAVLQKRYGGAGGRFIDLRLEPGRLETLRSALAHLPRGATMTVGSPAPGGAQYLLRHRGRTLTGRAGGIGPAARPAVKILDGFIDGIGVRKIKTDVQTHSQ
jgi:hypothetical protein